MFSKITDFEDNNHKWSMVAIVIVSIAVNIPYLRHRYFPVHDTLSVFQFFSYYYSQLLQLKELPWWLPFSAYGMPIDSYILFSLGPFQYLTLALGYLLHIHDALLLFSISLIGDTLFFALGSYLFCRHILQDKIATIVCVISLLLLVQYDRQLYWNFKLLLPLPFCLYFAQRGIESLNPAYILLSLATMLSWAFGSIPYVLPVQFYVVMFYCVFLVLLNSKSRRINGSLLIKIKAHLTNRQNLFLMLGALLVIIFCTYMMYSIRSVMVNEMAYNAIGRGSDFGVGLDYYLTYGGNTGPEKIPELLNGLPTSHPHDFLAFVGLVNLIFVVFSFFTGKKNNNQLALTLTALLVIAFTVTGTGVAQMAYVLPGMNVVRHVGYFITIAKMLIIILSGFGIHAYLHKQ